MLLLNYWQTQSAVISETFLYHFLMDQKNLEMFIYECGQINGGFSFNCLFQIMYGLEK